MSELILASASPYRAQLLQQVGLSFSAVSPQVDEEILKNKYQGPPQKLAEFLAYEKALSLADDYPESLIIGSDQVLLFGNKILSKPKSKTEVIERLTTLQGRTHWLLTAICLLEKGEKQSWTVEAQMTMHSLSPKEIEDYYLKDQALGCAGGYKIECSGPLLFEKIQTEDHYSIIGLPLLSLLSALRIRKRL